MPQPGGQPGPQQQGQGGGQRPQGPLDLRTVIQSVVRAAGPNANPHQIMAAVGRLTPLMNLDSQMQFREMSLQLREAIANQRDATTRRGQDVRADTAEGAQETTRRGQDIRADTAAAAQQGQNWRAQLRADTQTAMGNLRASTAEKLQGMRNQGRMEVAEFTAAERKDLNRLTFEQKVELLGQKGAQDLEKLDRTIQGKKETTELAGQIRSGQIAQQEAARDKRQQTAEEGKDRRQQVAEEGKERRAELSSNTRLQLGQLSADTRTIIADNIEKGKDWRTGLTLANRKEVAKMTQDAHRELTEFVQSRQDARTDKQISSRESVAAAGRESREGVAAAGRESREGIAAAGREQKEQQFQQREGRLDRNSIINNDLKYQQLQLRAKAIENQIIQSGDRTKLQQWRAAVDAAHKRAMEAIQANSANVGMDPKQSKALMAEQNKFYSDQIKRMGEMLGDRPRSVPTQSIKPPKPGDVVDNHKFKGGDPGDQKNWEPVGASQPAPVQ